MAQLKDTTISGSLRATDTIYTTNEVISSLTASAAVVTDANKKLVSRSILNNTSATAVSGSDSLITANTLVNAGYVKSSGVTSITIQTSSPLSGGSTTATTGTGSYTIGFANQNKNLVLAGPSTGSAAAPSFRALVADDIPTISASKASLGNVSNNANLNSVTGAKGDIIYWSAANTPAHLTNTSSTTKHFLSITSQVPSWVTLTNSDVGLGNVTNHAQVNAVTWNNSNKKITKTIDTTTSDVVIFSAGTDIELDANTTTLTINAINQRVEILDWT